MSDDEYFIESKKIRIKYEILLLRDLLYLNYKKNINSKNKINVIKVYNELENRIVFSKEEKEKIINDSLSGLENEYGLAFDQYGNLFMKK